MPVIIQTVEAVEAAPLRAAPPAAPAPTPAPTTLDTPEARRRREQARRARVRAD